MDKKKLVKLYREMSPEKLTLNEARIEIEIFMETLKEALLIHKNIKF